MLVVNVVAAVVVASVSVYIALLMTVKMLIITDEGVCCGEDDAYDDNDDEGDEDGIDAGADVTAKL